MVDAFELEGLENVIFNDQGEQVGQDEPVVLEEAPIYKFNLGKTDPGFQSFMRDFSNEDFHGIRTGIYEQRMQAYNDNISRGIYGLDAQGNIAVPQYIKDREWAASGEDLYPALKDAWTAQKTGIWGFL